MKCPSCGTENPAGAKTCSFCGNPLPAQPGMSLGETQIPAFQDFETLSAGDLIANRYQVIRELGRGGMGAVYLVRDQMLQGKEVALKLISPVLLKDPSAQERFVREVLAARSLAHVNIVKVFNLERYEARDFFTMEYLAGRSLREIMVERQQNKQAFSLREAIAVISPILSALSHAHSQNVIHRDLKPENIIVSGVFPEIGVKVVDFGLARIMSPSRLTSSALAMVTAYYMSPEQLSGKGEIDARSDLFAVGVILYDLLTGKIPTGRFPLPTEMVSGLPRQMDKVVDKALANQPDKRYSSAGEFSAALNRLSDIPEKQRQVEAEIQRADVQDKQAALADRPASYPSESTLTNSIGMRFVYIKPGTFMMGSPSSESGRDSDETQHRVTLTRGYYLQTTEVTQGQWRAVMGNNPSYFLNCGEGGPVEDVSWKDVQEFIRRLNQREGGNKYRLPTEAEWEYACRAGTNTALYNGGLKLNIFNSAKSKNLDPIAWYKGNSKGKTHSVGGKEPNAWGLYDMLGNVYEWCADWYGEYPSGSVTDPGGPSSGSYRVLRGGSWSGNASLCRSANRSYGPGYRIFSIGFRLALQAGGSE